MTNQQFFIQLTIITALTAAALFGLFQVESLTPYQLLGWISLGGFVLFTIFMYYVARSSALSSNKNTFTNAILGFTMGKMMIALMIIFAYLFLAKPPNNLFIIPFFLVYVFFTGFETYFMMKLGRMGV